MGRMGLIKNENHLEKDVLVQTNFTNAICYGKTGSGKTTGFILPNIENRIKENHGVLVYDFKGNTHEHVKKIAMDCNKLEKVIEIGTPWGEKTNIIQKLDSRTLKNVLTTIHGGTADKYWENASNNLLTSIYKIQINIQRICENYKLLTKQNIIIDNSKTEETSLASLYDVVSSVENLLRFIEKSDVYVKKASNVIELVLKSSKDKTIPIMKQIANHLENIIKAKKELEPFRKLDPSRSDIGGLNGVIDCASMSLSNAAANEYINTSNIDIAKSLRQGNIIIINLGNLDNNMLGLFNLSIYKALQSNLSNENSSSVTIFIDEAQKVLHPDYLPDVDVCRESKFEYIFATQDELLLNSTIGSENTQMLLRNIVEQYSFATNDFDSETSQLETFECKNLMTNRNSFTKAMFFSKEELFDVEYEYQANKEIRNLIDVDQIEELRVEGRFILVNSPLLYDRNEINIKTEDNKIYTIRLQNFDDDILNKYYPKINNKEELRSLSSVADLINNKSSSQENEIPVEERIQSLEILYKKTVERLNSLERKHELIENKNQEYFKRIHELEFLIQELLPLDDENVQW